MNERMLPEVYDAAMQEVKQELQAVNRNIAGVHERLDELNGKVAHHNELLWGDPKEPESSRQPGVVATVRYLSDLADKAVTVLTIAKWVFAFVGISLLILFAQNLLEAVSVIVQGPETVALP